MTAASVNITVASDEAAALHMQDPLQNDDSPMASTYSHGWSAPPTRYRPPARARHPVPKSTSSQPPAIRLLPAKVTDAAASVDQGAFTA